MPHIIVKLYPGREEAQKTALAETIADKVVTILECDRASVSVAFEEIPRNDWAERVYKPDIIENAEKLYLQPGYNPFQNP